MRKIAFFVLLTALILLLLSCGERKDAVTSQPGYEIVATIPPIGIFRHIFIDEVNSRGFLAADYMGVLVLDLSNPASPSIIDTLKNDLIDGGVGSTYYSDSTDIIYIEIIPSATGVGKHIRGFKLTDFDPSSYPLFTRGSPPVEKFMVREFNRDSLGITLTDSIHLYIADTDEIEKLDRTTMFRLDSTYTFLRNASYNLQKVYDFDIQDSYAYIAINELGMAILNLESNYILPVVGSFDSEGFCRGIEVQGDYCYMADRSWGLQVLDISNPAAPLRIANLLFPGSQDFIKVRVLNDRAVALDQYDGIFAVDISNPADPRLMFSFDTVTPTDVAITADYIYVVDEDAGLIIASW